MIPSSGTKYDEGKPLFSCLDPEALLDVGRVAAFGAAKYDYDNWKHVADGRRRYWDAAIRHLLAAQSELIDADSNLPHLAHAAWNCLACLFLERRKE